METHLKIQTSTLLYNEQSKHPAFITPKNFINFVLQYKKVLEFSISKISLNLKRLRNGLSQLIQAKVAVSEMENNILALAPKLAEAQN